MFDCAGCGAAAVVVDGRLSVVEHRAGCAIYAEAVRRRWPLRADQLPATPRPQAFSQRGASPRYQRIIEARERRRRAAVIGQARPGDRLPDAAVTKPAAARR